MVDKFFVSPYNNTIINKQQHTERGKHMRTQRDMIYEYCHVIAENGNMILFYEDDCPYKTAMNLKTGDQWSCDNMEQFEMLCEFEN
jgi:hypothetical protein